MAISLDLIYQTVKNSGVCSFSFLARKLNVPREQNRSLSRALNHLVERHDLFLTYDQEYFVPQFLGELEGLYSSGANRGYGFVKAEEKSVFILNRDSDSALNGDLVKVRYFKDVRNVSQNKETQLYQGYVLEVVKRNKEFFVGRAILENDFLSIKPLDSKIRGPFRFVKKPLVSLGDQIKVRIVEVSPREVLIELVRIIGKADDVAIDILSAIEDANVPYRFSTAARHQSQKLPTHVLEKDLVGRLDLREKLIVTIDGDDTKDFDDAIWVSKTKQGTFWLGVYIADVAYYVPEGTPLDHDAFERGTSVYLVDRVIPMLPFELSNGICSLNPDVDRLVLAIEMEIDRRGETLKYQISPAVIKSKKRLTYQAVNNYYRGEESFHSPELEKMLDQAAELATLIRRKKESEGYIDFEIQESKIIVNELGQTIDIVARDRDKSEMLIEDFMVRANEMIAQHIAKMELPFIYRVHSKPDLEKLTNLENVVRVLDLDVKIPRHAIPAEFALAIRQIKALRFDDFMKVMMLRTMAKAVYSPQNIGHFGLASTYYTHFTSPIRRYPDLIVHRMLRRYLFEKDPQASAHFREILEGAAEHCSLAEQRAMELERRVDDIKKAEFYAKLIGRSFSGQITTISKFGFFVEFPNKAGGLVHLSSLLDGKYSVEENGLVLRSNKRRFVIGDMVDVTIVKTFKNEGKIELVLSEFYELWRENNLIQQI